MKMFFHNLIVHPVMAFTNLFEGTKFDFIYKFGVSLHDNSLS